MKTHRRRFLAAGAALGVAAMATQWSQADAQDPSDESKAGHGEEISPAEDLMREHGAFQRILLIYDEAAHRLHADQEVPPAVLGEAASIVRAFVENYHAKLEEEHLFPRFRKADRLVALVDVLFQQHQAGRRLTDAILRLSTADAIKNADSRRTLSSSLWASLRMYMPHVAREDTVLFPAFRELVSGQEYEELGEQFEEKEHQLFGEHGFEKTVERIAALEKSMGIHDLAQFTPKE